MAGATSSFFERKATCCPGSRASCAADTRKKSSKRFQHCPERMCRGSSQGICPALSQGKFGGFFLKTILILYRTFLLCQVISRRFRKYLIGSFFCSLIQRAAVQIVGPTQIDGIGRLLSAPTLAAKSPARMGQRCIQIFVGHSCLTAGRSAVRARRSSPAADDRAHR